MEDSDQLRSTRSQAAAAAMTTMKTFGDLQETEELELVSVSWIDKKKELSGKQKISRVGECAGDELTLALGFTMNEETISRVSCEPLSVSSLVDDEGFNNMGKEMEEAAEEPWPSRKTVKAPPAARSCGGGDDEVSHQQAQAKRTRVSVRTRCDAPTINDGCQWRKYGQKISKGNPCPRAYYRCTVAPACPVRKQVQRCAEDMSILINTYEGTHNHPLPISATTMASTTSAAASMLISGSSSWTATKPAIGSPASSAMLVGLPTPADPPPLSAAVDYSKQSWRPIYLQNPSLSPTPTHPTITLDLTSPSPLQISQFNRSNSSNSLGSFGSTTLSFSSLDNMNLNPWSGNYSGNYNSKSHNLPLTLGGQNHHHQERSFFNSVIPKATVGMAAAQPPIHQLLTNSIAKAITSDPSFQSVLAAAITSYVDGGAAHATAHGGNSGSVGVSSSPAAASGVNVCSTTSFWGRNSAAGDSSSILKEQKGSSPIVLQPPMAPSGSRGDGGGGSSSPSSR